MGLAVLFSENSEGTYSCYWYHFCLLDASSKCFFLCGWNNFSRITKPIVRPMWEQVTGICQTKPRSPRFVFCCFCSNVNVRFCWNCKVWSPLGLQTLRMVKIALYSIDENALSAVYIWGCEILSSYFLDRNPVSSALMMQSSVSFEISAYFHQSKQHHIP